MSYSRERDEFIARMTREGLPIDVTRLLLREATGLNRRAELACSSEAADRDRVKCPASASGARPCLCDGDGHDGSDRAITRITLQDYHAEQRIIKAFGRVNAANKPTAPQTHTAPWAMETQGDPRGYVLRVIPPSYAERNSYTIVETTQDHELGAHMYIVRHATRGDVYTTDSRVNAESIAAGYKESIGVPSGPSGIRW